MLGRRWYTRRGLLDFIVMMIKKWERKWNRQAENHIFTLLCDITENLRLVSTVRKMMIIIRDQRPRTLLDKIAKFSSVCDFYHDNSSKSLVRFRLCDSAWAKTQQTTTLLMFSFVMDIFLVSFKFKHSEFIFEYWKLTSVTVSDDDAGKARKLSRIENCSISRWQQDREREMKRELYDDFTPHIMTLLWARKLVWNFFFRCLPVKSTCHCDFLWLYN